MDYGQFEIKSIDDIRLSLGEYRDTFLIEPENNAYDTMIQKGEINRDQIKVLLFK